MECKEWVDPCLTVWDYSSPARGQDGSREISAKEPEVETALVRSA